MPNCECKTVEDLKAENTQLRIEKQQLADERNQLADERDKLAIEKAALQELLKLEQSRKFSSKSEKSDPNQPELPFDMSEIQDAVKEELLLRTFRHIPARRNHPISNGRVEIPASLPRRYFLIFRSRKN